MDAIDTLMNEHRVIERVLTVLEEAARRIQGGDDVRPDLFLEAADFIRDFADGCHHRKEEDVLFREMIDAGMPSQSGPIAVMLMEHEQARSLTRGMREGATRWKDGDEGAKGLVARAAAEYARLLRLHIQKEDQVLFPLAGQAIPASRHNEVAAEFERVDSAPEEAGMQAKYNALADALVQEMKSWSE
jgi:hemerythrin-like domain-containing protein